MYWVAISKCLCLSKAIFIFDHTFTEWHVMFTFVVKRWYWMNELFYVQTSQNVLPNKGVLELLETNVIRHYAKIKHIVVFDKRCILFIKLNI